MSILLFLFLYFIVISVPVDPCNPSPCGANAICKERNGAGSCTCVHNYFGDPYAGCRPECLMSSDCSYDKACLGMKCRDPCPGSCGVNAECTVLNHNPQCTCLPGYTGNPLSQCREVPAITYEEPKRNPCLPSPCGPYSICRVQNDRPVCSCTAGYLGAPPNCRPECVVNSECPLDRACSNQKCVDPCPGTCGFNARCRVVNHNPICSCPSGYIGDPFSRCIVEESKLNIIHFPCACLHVAFFPEPPVVEEIKNPCIPSPCGLFSECRELNNRAICSCLPNYYGQPPNCKPECVVNSDCALTKTCQNERCRDPCPGSCGPNAECRTINHSPVCYCLQGFSGDPFTGCQHSKLTRLLSEICL